MAQSQIGRASCRERVYATVAKMDEAEQRISNTEDKLMENNEAEKKRETKAKEHNLRIISVTH